jgi:O-methyltransferase involved in polyketide biosynthesis
VRTYFLAKAIEYALPLRQQFVIVGAALDKRPFRMRDALLETSTFEVDFPDMLSANRQLFRSSASTATSCVTPRS